MRGSKRGTGGPDLPPPPEKSQKYRVYNNIGLDPLKNQSAFNDGPSSARQWNAIEMAFRPMEARF